MFGFEALAWIWHGLGIWGYDGHYIFYGARSWDLDMQYRHRHRHHDRLDAMRCYSTRPDIFSQDLDIGHGTCYLKASFYET